MKKYLLRFVIPIPVLLLFPAAPVSANAAPPPPHLWLHIAYEIQPAPTLIGMQLAACTNTECNTPRLLHQYGRCTADGCLPVGDSAPTGRFDCAADRCLVVATDYSIWQAEPQKWRIGLAIASLISVPCVYGMALVVGFALSYGRYLPTQVEGCRRR